MTTHDIKAVVREEYGRFADQQLEGSSACCESSACGDGDCCGSSLYQGEVLEGVPSGAVQASRGCGNPLSRALLQPGQTVLDLGSGGGLDAFLAAQRVGPEGYVYGVDMTDSMLELARTNATKAGITNVEFIKGDIEHLPLPDRHVDVIISNCVINLSPDKGQTLHEAFRVLRSGGVFAVSDIVIDGDLSGLTLDEATIRGALSWAGCIAGALTMDQYRALLTEAGFEEIEIIVDHRYSLDDFIGPNNGTGLSETDRDTIQSATQSSVLAAIDRDELGKLAQRFTSSLVRARKR